MTQHELKTWPEFFEPILSGDKTFELRHNDRGFRVGDILWLREWDQDSGYTGRELFVKVQYILSGRPWLTKGYAAMSIIRLSGSQPETPYFNGGFWGQHEKNR